MTFFTSRFFDHTFLQFKLKNTGSIVTHTGAICQYILNFRSDLEIKIVILEEMIEKYKTPPGGGGIFAKLIQFGIVWEEHFHRFILQFLSINAQTDRLNMNNCDWDLFVSVNISIKQP